MSGYVNAQQIAPEAYRALREITRITQEAELPRQLIELVKVRASQLNGCAFCIDMHARDARKLGETEQRLYVLSAWREAPFFSQRERAALEWTEALTSLSQGPIPEEVHARVRAEFTERELVTLTMAIIAINGFNRVAVGLGYHELLR